VRRRAGERRQAVDSHRAILAAAKTFLRWCMVEKKWIARSPIDGVKGVGKRRHGKMQLRIDEARKWLEAAIKLADSGKVRQEAGHGSGGLVFLDLLLDQVAMAPDEGPGVCEILGPQGGIGAEKLCIAGAQAARLLEHPDWNPCANDAGDTAKDARSLLDTRESVAEIARNPLQ
jgi:hypothetical protein